MKIITALNNAKLNEELKNEKNINLICKNIFYKEGILEILENEINIDYIILNNKLPGEIKLNNLIEKIIEKNEKIKIIILIKKENKNNFYKIKKEKINDNIEIVKDIKNKNIIRIFYTGEINLNKLKNYNIHDINYINTLNERNKKDKELKNNVILFLGERQVGKSSVIVEILKTIEDENAKILIMETNKQDSDIKNLFKKSNTYLKKFINNKKLKNKYKKIYKKYICKKNNLKIFKNLIKKINKNIDLISYNKLINLNIIKKLEKNYNYIFIEINLEKNNKILNQINEKILIIKPDILGIKNAKKIIEKNKINKYKIIINNYNKYSINTEIIEKIFKEKIIGKIKYNQEYDEIINNNFKISKENIKNLIKEFQVLNI